MHFLQTPVKFFFLSEALIPLTMMRSWAWHLGHVRTIVNDQLPRFGSKATCWEVKSYAGISDSGTSSGVKGRLLFGRALVDSIVVPPILSLVRRLAPLQRGVIETPVRFKSMFESKSLLAVRVQSVCKIIMQFAISLCNCNIIHGDIKINMLF